MDPLSNVESFSREPLTTYSRADAFLQPNHLQMLQDSAIIPEVSRARGYQTITRKSIAIRFWGVLNRSTLDMDEAG